MSGWEIDGSWRNLDGGNIEARLWLWGLSEFVIDEGRRAVFIFAIFYAKLDYLALYGKLGQPRQKSRVCSHN